jgi:predicted metal-binding membrane protein
MFLHVGKTASPEVREGGGPSPGKALAFVSSYLIIWVVAGLAIYTALAATFGLLPMETATLIASPVGLGLALILVALYQFSPVKGECLRRCHPSSFLFKYYKGGVLGSLGMGFQYAKYCVGCCWVMMVFLLAAASMGVLWMAVFAGIIFVERSLTMSAWAPRIIGVGFLFSGILFITVG